MTWTRTCWIDTSGLPEGMSHLALPVLTGTTDTGVLRCFATARDRSNRSMPVTAPVEVDGSYRLRLLEPWTLVAHVGTPGAFDESGLSLTDVRETEGGFEALTFGWRLRAGGGWFNEVGRIHMDAEGHLLGRSMAPWLPRSEVDPISMAYATFGGDSSILYCAPTHLESETGRPADFRILRCEESTGLRSVVLVPERLELPGVFALTRPWLVKTETAESLWFCFRGEKYRIGSVELSQLSRDEGDPVRIDELVPLNDHREAGSNCYPSFLKVGPVTLLLFNGSGYGATGFGVAVAELGQVGE